MLNAKREERILYFCSVYASPWMLWKRSSTAGHVPLAPETLCIIEKIGLVKVKVPSTTGNKLYSGGLSLQNLKRRSCQKKP